MSDELESAEISRFEDPDVFPRRFVIARNWQPTGDTKSAHRSGRLGLRSVIAQITHFLLTANTSKDGLYLLGSNCECTCASSTSASALHIVAVSKVGFTSASKCRLNLRHETDEDYC